MGRRFPFRITTATVTRFLLSLLIAFGIWAFVTNERDPDRTQVEPNVDLQHRGLASNLQIVEALPNVEVTLKGPRSVVQTIDDDDIQATVDMSNVEEPGDNELPVNVSTPDGLRAVEVEPNTVTVRVDSVITRTFPITIVEPANAPATLTEISLSSSSVTVVGVQQNVEAVDRVEVPIDLSGRSESFTYTAQLRPVDRNGEEVVETVLVEPSSVQVTVEFEVGSRSVPVIVQCACPTEGGGVEVRDLLTATSIPPTVRIEGPQPLLESVTAIRTVPISIDDIEISDFVSGAIELDVSGLPEGVTVERPAVNVYVQVEQSVQGFSQQELEVINEPPNMRITVSPETISFEVEGSAEALATLEDSPPMVVVDLSGLTTGTHVITPRVVVPPDVRVVNLEPNSVEVSIERIPPTPTPEPAAPPSTSSSPAQSESIREPSVNDTIN